MEPELFKAIMVLGTIFIGVPALFVLAIIWEHYDDYGIEL